MFKSKKLGVFIVVYCALLYFIWAAAEFGVVAKIETSYGYGDAYIIKELVMKPLIWFVPAIILLSRFNEYMFIKKEELFSFKRSFLDFDKIFVLFTALHLIMSYIVNDGRIVISPDFSWVAAFKAVSIGFSEEMVFRGWLLNATLKENNKCRAVAINAVLFLAVHFGVWIRQGYFIAQITSGSFLQIVILSVLFSLTFIKSRSVIVPALIHGYWDFLCYLL